MLKRSIDKKLQSVWYQILIVLVSPLIDRVRSLLPRKLIKPPDFMSRGKIIDDDHDMYQTLIAEARSNPRFIVLENHLVDEGFSIKDKPTAYSSYKYDLRNWSDIISEPFSFQNPFKHLNSFQSELSMTVCWFRYCAVDRLKTATSQYVVIARSVKPTVCVRAEIFQAEQKIFTIFVDHDHMIHVKPCQGRAVM